MEEYATVTREVRRLMAELKAIGEMYEECNLQETWSGAVKMETADSKSLNLYDKRRVPHPSVQPQNKSMHPFEGTVKVSEWKA